jgi:hypothetical protein
LYRAVFRYSHWSKGDRSRDTPVTKSTACGRQGFAGFRQFSGEVPLSAYLNAYAHQAGVSAKG